MNQAKSVVSACISKRYSSAATLPSHVLLLQDVFVSFITDPQQQATPGQPGEIHTDTVPEFDIIAMMSVPNSNYKRVEIIDDLKDFLKDLDLNNVRCLWMDGHSDQNGNLSIRNGQKVPPEALRVALMAAMAYYGRFKPFSEPIPIVFGSCFNHVTIEKLNRLAGIASCSALVLHNVWLSLYVMFWCHDCQMTCDSHEHKTSAVYTL